MQIRAAPLTDDAFGPFGEIVVPRTAGRSANADMARRYDHVVSLHNGRVAAAPKLALFEVLAYNLKRVMNIMGIGPLIVVMSAA